MERVVSLFQHVHTGSLSLFSSRRTNVDCIVRTMDTGRNVLKESQKVEFCKVSVGSKIGGDGEITRRAVCRSRCVINRISLFFCHHQKSLLFRKSIRPFIEKGSFIENRKGNSCHRPGISFYRYGTSHEITTDR